MLVISVGFSAFLAGLKKKSITTICCGCCECRMLVTSWCSFFFVPLLVIWYYISYYIKLSVFCFAIGKTLTIKLFHMCNMYNHTSLGTVVNRTHSAKKNKNKFSLVPCNHDGGFGQIVNLMGVLLIFSQIDNIVVFWFSKDLHFVKVLMTTQIWLSLNIYGMSYFKLVSHHHKIHTRLSHTYSEAHSLRRCGSILMIFCFCWIEQISFYTIATITIGFFASPAFGQFSWKIHSLRLRLFVSIMIIIETP